MKVLICGSRDWTDWKALSDAVYALPQDAIIIAGGARGVDAEAKVYAEARGLFVAEVRVASAHWNRFGKRAGNRRNEIMLDLQPDRVLAFQLNGSRGTQHTIDEARRRGIPVEVVERIASEVTV